jgi:hypothetical protein
MVEVNHNRGITDDCTKSKIKIKIEIKDSGQESLLHTLVAAARYTWAAGQPGAAVPTWASEPPAQPGFLAALGTATFIRSE